MTYPMLSRTRTLTAWPQTAAVTTTSSARPLLAGPSRTPTLGIALSGGGARGFAHIGVLEALETIGISPRVVTGTSMGGIVGGLYAYGLGPIVLRTAATSTDWASLLYPASLSNPAARQLLGPQLRTFFSVLTEDADPKRDFTAFPRAFACLAADATTGEAVRLTEGDLSLALLATMAHPDLLDPVPYGLRTLVDGGPARLLPAKDARALGADFVIGVDVSDFDPAGEPDSKWDATSLARHQAQLDACDLVIRPALGAYQFEDFAHAEDIIHLGSEAIWASLLDLRRLLRTMHAEPLRPSAVPH